MQHGVGGQLQQGAAVEERNDLNSGRKDTVIQFVHFLVNLHQRGVRFGAFAKQHDPRDNIVVVDDLAIGQTFGPPELPQPNLRALLHYADITNA